MMLFSGVPVAHRSLCKLKSNSVALWSGSVTWKANVACQICVFNRQLSPFSLPSSIVPILGLTLQNLHIIPSSQSHVHCKLRNGEWRQQSTSENKNWASHVSQWVCISQIILRTVLYISRFNCVISALLSIGKYPWKSICVWPKHIEKCSVFLNASFVEVVVKWWLDRV